MASRQLIGMLFIAGVLVVASGTAAAIQCYQCHGTAANYQPLDAPYRNISTGGFQGNHRTHTGAGAVPAACDKCHPGSSGYPPSHRNGFIRLASHLNGSPLATPYRNTTSAFPQSATPTLGSCSGVNCHFETPSPTWGSAPFTGTGQCASCHEGTVPLSATHATHRRYSSAIMGKFSSYTACATCHVNYVSPPAFSHATSAGRHPITVSVGGYNSGSTTYLPSQTHGAYGSCTNLYCHSPGTRSAAPYPAPLQTATWGTTLRSDCSGCHKGSAASFRTMSSGSHTRHVGFDGGGSSNRIDCVRCHAATVTAGLTLRDLSRHVNGAVDVAFDTSSTAVNGTYNGSLTPVAKTPGTAYGACNNVYCHSNGQNDGGTGITYRQPTWGNAASGACGSCHDVDAGYGHGTVQIATGSHPKHLAYAFTTSSNSSKCTICHNVGGLAFNGSCSNTCHGTLSRHANHQVDVLFPASFGAAAAYNGSPNPGSGYGSCANVYCHSNGTSVATGTVPATTSPVWGAGGLACTGCHDYPPSYANGSPKANSHAKHAAAGFGCNACHAATTADGTTIADYSRHVNMVYDLVPGAGVSFTYVFAAGGGTCSAISCHNNGTAVWGTTLTCADCHTVSPGGD